ncbi:MAG: DUF4012 domain-containing protein, partial [Anaerolineae bacterium]|nr:DUF4012 domain-containing protein [Anaerolineae bacterium]MDW8071981.1 DUF4012 domain-containing protein [Anaerolineae bacterium]
MINSALLAWHARLALVGFTELKSLIADHSGTQPLDITNLRLALQRTGQALAAVRWHATPFIVLAPYFGWLPEYGDDIAAVPHLLEAVRSLIEASLTLLDGLAPHLESLRQGTGPDQDGPLPILLTTLADAAPQLAQAEVHLSQAEAHWEQIPHNRLTPQLAERLAPLARYLPLLRTVLQLAHVAPALLGDDGPRHYLLLAQNEDEQRPTGGFISAAGLITLDRGRITALRFDDSYAVDDLTKPYPEPPEVLRRTMLAELWLFRDTNWSPDFPTSARIAADFYTYGRGVAVDGVVAFDQKALQYLLEGLGPVTISGTGETIHADNVIAALRVHWAPGPGQQQDAAWWVQRKFFIGKLAEAMRRKFESNSLDWIALAGALERALGEKHLLLYSPQPEVAGILNRAGWDGSVRPWEGDYLMVVDANVGFNKASALVTRQVEHTVALDAAGGAEIHTRLTYYHTGRPGAICRPETRYDPIYEQMMQRCLWNYVRLYLPAQAVIVATPRRVVPAEEMLSGEATGGEVDITPGEGDKQSLGLLFVLPPGENATLEYRYRLPNGTVVHRVAADTWQYDLLVQKQPGSDNTTVQVVVQLPSGGRLVHSL